MTEPQRKQLYWPAWARAFRAHWRTEKGVIHPQPTRPYCARLPQIEDVARQLAALDHRALTANDLRHACHILATGKSISSNALTNRQLDDVLAIFRELADPDDLQAAIDADHPELAANRRTHWTLRHRVIPGYLAAECERIYGTRDWEGLSPDKQARLLRHLRARPKAWVRGREREQGRKWAGERKTESNPHEVFAPGPF